MVFVKGYHDYIGRFSVQKREIMIYVREYNNSCRRYDECIGVFQ